MPEASDILDRRTTKSRSILMASIRGKHQDIAKAIGINPSTFSEWLNTNVDRLAVLLTIAELKPVPTDWRCVDPTEYAQLKKWAIQRLQMHEDSEDTALKWDTPQ